MSNLEMKYLVPLFLLFTFGCEGEDPVADAVQDLKVYNFEVRSLEHTPDDRYILNCTDRLVCLSSDGAIAWTKMHNLFTDTLANGAFQLAQSITTPALETIVLGSVVSGNTVHMLYYKLDASGEVIMNRKFLISDVYQEKGPRSNQQFYMHDNNYPIACLSAQNGLYVAFSFDDVNGNGMEGWVKYALLIIDQSGVLKFKKDFTMGDFYGRIYSILESSSGNVVVSRGGMDWLAYDIYDPQFDLVRGKRFSDFAPVETLPAHFGEPILNAIKEIDENNFLFTGHIDLLDNPNPNFVSDFDFFTMLLNDDGEVFQTQGEKEFKELTHSSFTSDGSVHMVGARRGENGLLQDVRSDLVVITRSTSGSFSEKVIVKGQGMEGVFAHENPDKSITIVGTKTGFTNTRIQSFFMRYKPQLLRP